MDAHDVQRDERSIGEGRSANHFELAFTDEEFLLDFGQAYDPAAEPLMHTRIIMTPRNVTTFAAMLDDLIEQYRQRFSSTRQEN